jgi:transcriptional/translational regulatory protein YebC/TACO1
MRKLFEKGNGNLSKPGAVAFGFTSTGVILIEDSEATEDQLMEVALDAGASDIKQSEGGWEVTCEPIDFLNLRQAIENADIKTMSAEVTMVPATSVTCDIEQGAKMLRLIESFEDHDDVQNVYSNADIPEEAMEV